MWGGKELKKDAKVLHCCPPNATSTHYNSARRRRQHRGHMADAPICTRRTHLDTRSSHQTPLFPPMTQLYPRSTLKRLVKAHQPKSQLSKNADVLLYLDYVLFLNRLATEARIAALKNNDKTVESRHINAVLEVVLQQFKA
ncbi:hypothetical protein BC937DRAFT_87832 [Endogone sp. FLAS-F59071]|nr:hypothetical protein BC937DRAFT_87832 [Endogone sp. FLAS-F59071]|eukprot:RUS19211.1 hypothetical protein BC937DRAFT_87832 [Endogone sp. FLAS-F59071]